ncbi:universal stress protein [Chryseolinea sp. T2]|uniref:universal stress protein n=1 Tax=Chryseolinea sp. T2 TaxID=3129255 RepID=UPI0030785C7B
MKTILAPVDFSTASRNALLFAAEIARRSSAQLVVGTVVQAERDEYDASTRLEDTLTSLRNSFGGEVQCTPAIASADLIDGITQIIGEHQPDLIVMGTKGASGLKEILIGSNTVKVISKTTVPVLVVPESARFDGFLNTGRSTVVLATDLEAVENESALDLLKEIALLIIKPKVKVVSVRPKNTELDYMKRLQRDALLGLFSPEIESERATVFSNNVMSGLNYYLSRNEETGLVAMIARDTGQLIQRHFTHEMASHTHLPLLILHDSAAG